MAGGELAGQREPAGGELLLLGGQRYDLFWRHSIPRYEMPPGTHQGAEETASLSRIRDRLSRGYWQQPGTGSFPSCRVVSLLTRRLATCQSGPGQNPGS